MHQHLAEKSIDAIVAETYLGPPRNGHERRGDLQKSLHELTDLYYQSLSVFRKVLKPDAPVVLALPVYIIGLEKHGISVEDFKPLGFEPDQLLPQQILSRLGVRETKNHGLLYGRNDQFVWREIVRLRVRSDEKSAK